MKFEFGDPISSAPFVRWDFVGVVSDGARGAVWRAVALQVGR